MEKIRAVIVDDELAARTIMTNLIELAHPEINVVESHSHLLEAVSAIKRIKPDVVFLDVEMPQYSGYEIVNFFDEIPFQIVFVTAYDKYAIKAFEVKAIDYLLKPVKRQRLSEAVERIKENINQKKTIVDYHSILEEMKSQNSPTIMLTEVGKKELIKTKEIVAIQAKGAYADVFLKDGRTVLMSKNIGALEELLNVDPLFFRSHKSWILNMDEILVVQSAEENIVLKNGLKCKLSRFKKAEFKAKMQKLTK